ncbi:ADP-ribosylation factor 1-like [Mya arenaria]|uniref:ADP-ribosylation factor 1-like n=1 Tax=Mya arenaria TaxID=6604 RepID=UPI0022E548C1|nr:ADP-ribosylation factor 1-like [Mya arenaria]
MGLDGAGKTTLLYRLKLGEVMTHVPTIGFNVEQLHYKNITFTTWDIGARDKMRPLFRHYYKGTDAVVMVIDGADSERLEELYCDVIKPALHAEELAHSIFLFLVNKRDLPECLSAEEVADKLNLKALKHSWHILETSAVRGDGLTDSMDWLASHLGPTSGQGHRKQQSPQGSHDAIPNDVKRKSDLTCDKNDKSDKNRKQHSSSLNDVRNDVPNGDLRPPSGISDSKEVSPAKDFCHFNRAYSAFRCFFIRPSVPPDTDSDDDD